MVIRAHVDVVLALLTAVPNVRVHDGIVPDKPTLPYVVVRTNSGPRSRSSLAVSSDHLTLGIWCTSVAANRAQAQWLAEKVTGALLDVTPTVAGRACFPIEAVNSQPVQRDDSVNPPLMYAVDEFRLSTVPA